MLVLGTVVATDLPIWCMLATSLHQQWSFQGLVQNVSNITDKPILGPPVEEGVTDGLFLRNMDVRLVPF